MKKLALLFVLLTMCVMPKVAVAAIGSYDPALLNTQYMQDIRNFDFRKENANRFQPKTYVAGNIEVIKFVNNRAFSEPQLQEIVSGYIGQPATSENIMQIRKAIMKFYQDHGYYSATASVESGNPKDKTLVFSVEEGTKDSIQLDN